MPDEYIKNLVIGQLIDTPIGDRLQSALKTFEKVQLNLSALAEKEDETHLTKVKIGTVLTLSILKRLVVGKQIRSFSQDDWIQISNEVSDYAILSENQKYSEFVFKLYADYIDASADSISGRASEKTVSSIRTLADELRCKTELLENEQITEANYIEDCLWICLDAMMKLLASSTTIVLPTKAEVAERNQVVGNGSKNKLTNAQLIEDFSQAVATFAFEYGRYVLLKNENNIITEYIQNQYVLTEELERKYADFTEELEMKSVEFQNLIDNAFCPDFRESFLHSVELALSAGVDDSEILRSVNDIDDFFMN